VLPLAGGVRTRAEARGEPCEQGMVEAPRDCSAQLDPCGNGNRPPPGSIPLLEVALVDLDVCVPAAIASSDGCHLSAGLDRDDRGPAGREHQRRLLLANVSPRPAACSATDDRPTAPIAASAGSRCSRSPLQSRSPTYCTPQAARRGSTRPRSARAHALPIRRVRAIAARPCSSMPAHGGIDPGAVGSTESGLTVYEADVTLPIELEAMRLLTGDGFRVVVSRTRAESVVRLTNVDVSDGVLTAEGVHNDVAARDICANDAGANILIGIYMDAGEGGAGSLTGYDPDRPFAAANLRLAALVQDDVLAAMKRAGVADPRPRDTARHRARVGQRSRLSPRQRGPGLWTPAAARAGGPWLLLDAKQDARGADRAAVHHRPIRGLNRGQRPRAGGDRPRHRRSSGAVLQRSQIVPRHVHVRASRRRRAARGSSKGHDHQPDRAYAWLARSSDVGRPQPGASMTL
jgi:N-acetylmuramoyl-L-alanine amidase